MLGGAEIESLDHGDLCVNLSPLESSPYSVKELSNPPISLAEQIERIERALSVTEVARLLSLCRASVYRYIDAGIIPAIRIGTTLRVDPKALAQCLRRRALVPDLPVLSTPAAEPPSEHNSRPFRTGSHLHQTGLMRE